MDISLIVENALSDFDAFRLHCDKADYSGVVNPMDKVFYPGITQDIPKEIQNEIIGKIQYVLGRDIKSYDMFIRLQTEGEEAPHQAHNDYIMGDGLAIIYLNREEHCKGGTSLVSHIETGMSGQPDTEELLKAWQRDHNDYNKWKVDGLAEMKPNRMLLIESDRMHRAEPAGGFGKDSLDGRTILGCFFRFKDDN